MLRIENLSIGYRPGLPAVHGVDLDVAADEVLGLVGESGSGKTTLGRVLLGLLPEDAWATGSARFDGLELVGRAERDWSDLRGRRVGVVPQGAMSGLGPVNRVQTQLVEAIRLHTRASRQAAQARAAELLALVRLDTSMLRAYPHQLSGGQRQRVAVALALAGEPDLVVADEPTTGLDLITQEHVLELLGEVRDRENVAMLIISHDLPGILAVADRVAVMYAGRVVELRDGEKLGKHCVHPYTKGLLAASASVVPGTVWSAIPGQARPPGAGQSGCGFAERCPVAEPRCRESEPELVRLGEADVACHRAGDTTAVEFPAVPGAGAIPAETGAGAVPPEPDTGPVVVANSLRQSFPGRRRTVHALRGVDLEISRGEILGLVGESGSGKTTLGRILLGLQQPSAGKVWLDGIQLTGLSGRALREQQRRTGFVHQDPYGSLHPAMTVQALVAEPLALAKVAGVERLPKIREALSAAGLPKDEEFLGRLPSSLSGGQRQRVAIARALVTDPVLLVADEATSMLDVSTRAGIATTLRGLAGQRGLAVLFVTHDLGEAMHACDRVLVLRAGELVEAGPPHQLAAAPAHAYTAELVAAGRRRSV
ncbi:ABC transporter ATP-binding protein [Streptomyces sp. NPDC050433]|uniref:ABC transporter ATP-binding protein n=1 Tax=Streptomyces sp. NPDC050433 TaxID=3365615 RepID=UPI00378870BD